MLARSRNLRLTDRPLRGPLLVPSVSSKGFPLIDGVSEAGASLRSVAQDLTDSLLVSAYDLAHRFMPEAEMLLGENHRQTIYETPELLIVDSGGYELNAYDFEAGETRRGHYAPRTFTRADFEAVADRLPHDRELLVVSYDEPIDLANADSARATYRTQRETAQRFFAARPHLKSDFLLKPEGRRPFLDIVALTVEAPNLRAFDVIGVTEKELGRTVLDRLVALARLRILLDGSGCRETPIHVFGSLDPLYTPLYFMAGGEIFDGLSWLRYAYIEDLSAHPDQLAVLTGNTDDGEETREMRRLMSNLAALGAMHRSLARWAAEPERYEHLGSRHVRIREVYDDLRARLALEG